MNPEDRYARAVEAADAYRKRVVDGQAEPLQDLLREHDELRDLLEILLDDDDQDSLPATMPAQRVGFGRGRLPRGESFARFPLLGCIGQGGMGAVYLAFDETLDRPVALKLIRPEYLHVAASRTRFEREARAVSRLDQPNLCRVFEAGEHDGIPYLVMQYVKGETLSARLDAARSGTSLSSTDGMAPAPGRAHPRSDAHVDGTSTPPSTRNQIDSVLRMIEKLARALHYAHENGLVHRDVKPPNVMIKPDGEPVLLDFGLVRDESGADLTLTGTGEMLGTPLYMAPEQILPARGAVDRRTDVYALGAVLYECLTLARPFDAPTRHELFTKILREPPVDPSSANPRIPRDLQVVALTAMDKDPARRYATAEDLAEDLRRVRAHEPIRARPAGVALRAWRWTQRNPVAATFLVTITLSLVVSASLLVETARATARYDEVSGHLSNVGELDELEQDAAALPYPDWPVNSTAFEDWLRRADPLVAKLPALRQNGVHLQDRPGATDTYLLSTLQTLVRRLDALADPDIGTMAGVRRRLEWAREVGPATIEAHRERWDAAIEAIAAADGATASERYAERPVDLVPQLGLVPLGMDPDSRLWEFLHLRSGARDAEFPERDEDTGKYRITPNTGIVFVLIPGSRFTMGGQGDPLAESDELPAHDVDLAPFFLAKHELTQGQWIRIARRAPSNQYPSGTDVDPKGDHRRVTDAHPVEMVRWKDCIELLGRHALTLPTEAQWEYACRAGTETPWTTGTDPSSLEGYANLADATLAKYQEIDTVVGWDDGHAIHAPVGTFAPNGFGLHDMLGNVSELCLDWYDAASYALAPEPRTGRHPTGERTHIVVRGGNYRLIAKFARSADRQRFLPGDGSELFGVRAARPVLPDSGRGD